LEEKNLLLSQRRQPLEELESATPRTIKQEGEFSLSILVMQFPSLDLYLTH
jgi:hypothetical protein